MPLLMKYQGRQISNNNNCGSATKPAGTQLFVFFSFKFVTDPVMKEVPEEGGRETNKNAVCFNN